MTTYSRKERKERVLKYFMATPSKPKNVFWGIILVGLVVLIIKGYLQDDATGIAFIIVGLLGLYAALKKFITITRKYWFEFKRSEPKATDKEMDGWLSDCYRIVLEEAKRRLGIDEEDISADPFWIDGPGAASSIAPGRDLVLRFNQHNILLLFLTDHNIATYKCIFDLGLGEILSDSTQEFPYRDITNLETKTAADTFYYYKGAEKTMVRGIQTLSLHTSGGNLTSANFFFRRDVDEDYKMPPSNADLTIKAIRQKLMEYKNRYGHHRTA